MVSNGFCTELTFDILAGGEERSVMSAIQISQFTHLLARRREEPSVMGFALSSQYTYSLEPRMGEEQSVTSFIQRS